MLYIGIPAYNEATTIGVLLWRLRSVLSEVSREYEVVVYDDASTDETASTLAPYSRVLPLTVLRGAQRIGYAGAVDALARHVARTTRYPRRDALLLLQGDFTDPPELVPEFLRRFEGGADLIIGERTTAGDAPTAVRRLWTASRWVLRPFVGITDVRDLTASYRLVRIAVLRDLIKAAGDTPVAVGDGWSANADFLLRAAPFARRVETIPVTPNFGVRTRDSRRTAWPDALALAKWGWGRRGQRVAVKVIARTVEVTPDADETASADVPEHGAPSERRERPERGERRPRRDAADRPEREKTPRAEREKTPRAEREKTPRAEREKTPRAEREKTPHAEETAAVSPVVGLAAEDLSESAEPDASRKPRKRRKRGARRERVQGADAGADAGADGGADDSDDVQSLGVSAREEAVGAADDGDVETTESGGEGAARTRRKRSRRGRRRKGGSRAEGEDGASESATESAEAPARLDHSDGSARDESAESDGDDESDSLTTGASQRRRSRRGRRGGSRRRTDGEAGGGAGGEPGPQSDGDAPSAPPLAQD